MSLYHLSSRYQQLLDLEEYTDEEMQELQALHSDIEDQCIERGKHLRNLEAELSAVTDARKQMQEREKQLAERMERNELRLADIMRSNNIDRITKSPLFPLRVKQNPVSVDVVQLETIPENYWKESIPKPVKSIDKTAIKLAIESGTEVPGARLVQKLRVEFK